jgi:hypothetical protein
MNRRARRILLRLGEFAALALLHQWMTGWMDRSRAMELILAGGLSAAPHLYLLAVVFVALRLLVILVLPAYVAAWLWMALTDRPAPGR